MWPYTLHIFGRAHSCALCYVSIVAVFIISRIMRDYVLAAKFKFLILLPADFVGKCP